MKCRIFLFIVLLFFIGCKVNSENSRKILTKEEIFDAANKAVKSSDFYRAGMKLYYDEGNKKWEKTFEDFKRNDPEGAAEFSAVLKGRSYQTIYYDAGEDVIDGSRWLFMDKTTGDLIIFFHE